MFRSRLPAHKPRLNKYIGCLIVLLLIFSSVQIYTAWTWGMPGYSSWAVDTVGGGKILGWVKARMRYTGPYRQYPPLHRYLLAATYAPLISWHGLRGNLDFERDFINDELTVRTSLIRFGRLVTVLMAAVLILIIFRIGNLLGQPGAGLLAAGLWSGNYLVAYYSQTSNLDVPYLFWIMLSLERLLKFHMTGNTRWLIVSAMLAAMAAATKDQAVTIAFSFPILLSWSPLQEKPHFSHETLKGYLKRALLFIIVAFVCYGILSQAFWRPFDYHQHLRFIFGKALIPHQTRIGPLEFTAASVLLFYRSLDAVVCSMLIVGIFALLFTKPRIFLWLTVPIVVYHFTFLLPSRLLQARQLLPHMTLLSIVAGIGMVRLLEPYPRLRNHLIPLLAFVAYFSSLSLHTMLWNDPRQNAEEWLQSNPEVGASLASYCSIRHYLPPVAQVNAKVVNTPEGRPVPVKEDYLICVSACYGKFAKGPFWHEWQELLLGNRDLKLVKSFSNGATVFQWFFKNKKPPKIPGLAQSIHILQRSPPESVESHIGT